MPSPAPPPARSTRGGFPPGPGPLNSARELGGFFADPVGFYTRLHERYGEIVGVRIGRLRLVMVYDLDLLHEVLVSRAGEFRKGRGVRATKPIVGEGLFTSDGDHWRRQRRIAQPAFQPRNLAPYADVMVAETQRACADLRDGARVDMHDVMIDVTISIASRTMFGRTLDADTRATFKHATETVLDAYKHLVLPATRLRLSLPLPWVRRFRAAREELDRTVYAIIAGRRAAELPETRDLLSLMLESRDEDGTGMTDLQLRDEALTLLLAGHETAAQTQTWTLAMLAQHPDILAAVQREIDDVCGDRAPTGDDVAQLQLTRRTIAESLRIYPTVYSTVREPLHELELGGYRIAPGTDVAIPIAAVHRDRRWYERPDDFDPDRFLDAASEQRPKLAYIPFGSGKRVCIGQSYAWMEMVLVIATILQRWTPELAPGHVVAAEALFSLRPVGGLPMIMHARR